MFHNWLRENGDRRRRRAPRSADVPRRPCSATRANAVVAILARRSAAWVTGRELRSGDTLASTSTHGQEHRSSRQRGQRPTGPASRHNICASRWQAA